MDENFKQKFVTIGVYFLGNNLLPEEITNTLKIEPTYSKKKGDRWNSSTGEEIVAKIGCWELYARHKAASENLADQIRFIVESLGDKIGNLEKVEGIDRAFINIFYSLETHPDSRTVEVDFSAKELMSLTSLGLPVQITIPVLETEETTPPPLNR
ncbi:MAG: DUF4279 domain-containing protein [Betaproteobacteria bacterium]|nr:DUF4279 domain-containing protein [Betaproteobacteria bacterium]